MFWLYSFFFFLIIGFELSRKKRVLIDFLTLFNLFFVFRYIAPAVVFLWDKTQYQKWRFFSVVPEAPESVTVLAVILFAYMVLVFSFSLGRKAPIAVRGEINAVYGEGTFLFLFLMYLVFCIVFFFLYTHGLGGTKTAILNAAEVRAGRLHGGIYQYSRYFMQSLPVLSVGFLSIYLQSDFRQIRQKAKWLFCVSFCFSLLYALSTGGRGNIGTVFLLPLILTLNNGRGITFKKCVYGGFFVLFILLLVVYGKSVIWRLNYLAEGNFSTFANEVILHAQRYSSSYGETATNFFRNVDHTLSSIYTTLADPEFFQIPRLFFDWPRAFFSLIPGVNQPEALLSSTPSGLMRDYFLHKLPEIGYVPPGWIAMQLMNGGFFWLTLGTFLSGYIGGALDCLLARNLIKSPAISFFYIFFMLLWNNSIAPDPFMFFLPNIGNFFICLMFIRLYRLRVNKCTL